MLGKLNDKMTKGMRLQHDLYGAVIQLESLMTAEEKSTLYVPLSQFPPVTRDVAFIAPLDMENSKVIDFIRRAKVPNLVNVEIFDIFKGEPLKEGTKSMAYTLTFRSDERTLTDQEVNDAHEKLRATLVSGLGVELR